MVVKKPSCCLEQLEIIIIMFRPRHVGRDGNAQILDGINWSNWGIVDGELESQGVT